MFHCVKKHEKYSVKLFKNINISKYLKKNIQLCLFSARAHKHINNNKQNNLCNPKAGKKISEKK